MTRITLLVLLTLLSSSVYIYAQQHTTCYANDDKAHPRPNNIDVSHLLVELSFDANAGKVFGRVTHTYTPLHQQIDTLFFDAPSIIINEVSVDNIAVKYKSTANGLIVYLAQPQTWESEHKISISYEAQPRRGMYFIGWNDPLNTSRKQIWTQGQATDNRHWLPSFDDMRDKVVSKVIVTFDADYQVLSNGELASKKKQKDGSIKWHYKMTRPHSPYLIMLAIGDYAINTVKSENGVLINNWYYPQYPKRVEPTYRYSGKMMDWMEKEFGLDYPWHAYSQVPVQDFMYGAMENTTATVFGDFYFVDKRQYLDRYYVGVNAHELVHQWFGDYITTRSPEHHWLHESFATHYAKQFQREVFGEDSYRWIRRGELNSTLNAAKNNNHPIVHTQAGSSRYYPKGSLVLDMFKYVIGREQFNKALAHYLKKHAYNTVDTHDFYIAFLETLGMDLGWFFNQWLYRGGEPHYEVIFQNITKEGKQISQFLVKQIHERNDLTSLFKMPIVFEVHYSDGTYASKREWIENESHIINLANPENKKIAYVLFDPNDEVIKQLTFDKPLDMLKTQALAAENMIDRYDAVMALKAFDLSDTRGTLSILYKKEPFHAVRSAIVTQLVNDAELSDTLLQAFINDPHQRVRETVINQTTTIPEQMLKPFEALLSDSSYAVVSSTLNKLSAQYPENIGRYMTITENDLGRGSHVKIKWHEVGLNVNREKHLRALVQLTSVSNEYVTRINAINALKNENYLNAPLASNLFNAMLNPNWRLATPAKNAIVHYLNQKNYKALIIETYNSATWESWQSYILSPIVFK